MTAVDWSTTVRNWTVAALVGVLTVSALYLIPVAKDVNGASAALLRCTWYDKSQKRWRSNAACVQSVVLATSGSIRNMAGSGVEVMGMFKKSLPELVAAVQQSASNSVAASEEARKAAEQATLLIQDLRGLLNDDVKGAVGDLRKVIQEAQRQLQQDGDAANEDLKAVKPVLDNLAALEVKLAAEIDRLDPELVKTLQAIDALVSDSNIKSTIAHIEKGTNHGAEIAETFDIATRKLREKTAMVKAILGWLAGFVKLTFHL